MVFFYSNSIQTLKLVCVIRSFVQFSSRSIEVINPKATLVVYYVAN